VDEHQYHWYCTSQDILSTTRNKCTDMSALAHKCWHTHLQCLHARTYARKRTHANAHTHARAHTRMHTHAHAQTHACVRACMPANKHACTYVHTRTHACTRGCAPAHKHACTHSSILVQHFGQGDMLFYRLACVHMCVWHRTTGIALCLGFKSRQSSTEPILRISFLPGSIVHGTLHAFQIRCRISFGKGEFWQI
jgi:hypothetical protein